MAGSKINLTFKDLMAAKAGEAAKAGTGAGAKSKPTKKVGQFSNGDEGDQPTSVYRGAPVKIAVGKTNIRIDATASGDELGRRLNEAFNELAGNLAFYVNQLENYLPQDLEAALEPTMELAKHYCPVDTGALRESAYLATEKYRGGCRVEFGFAKGGIPEYAVFVHEMPFEHAYPTTNKFMQRAIDEDYFGIIQRVTDNVKIRSGAF